MYVIWEASREDPWDSNTIPTFGRPPGRLIGGVWGGRMPPPGIKLSFVFWQPRDSMACFRLRTVHCAGSHGLPTAQI